MIRFARPAPLLLAAALRAAVPASAQTMLTEGTPTLVTAPPPAALGLPGSPTPATARDTFLPSPTSVGAASAPGRPGGDPADVAFGAFQRGYFATALAEATARLAKAPADGAAMALIGEIYNQGLAVRPDPGEADRWFKLASERGNREGAFAYGLALLRGTGVAKDLGAAEPYLVAAAAKGHAGALYNLGILALEADVRTRNYAKAADFFQQATDKGDIDAEYALASLYKSGEGVPRDLARAGALFKAAADEQHPAAQIEYAIMLFNGEGVPKDEAAAARYFRMAAYGGNPVAANRLARLYAAGRGVQKNGVEAARWHLLARAAGIADPWLDGVFASLTPADKRRVEDQLRKTLAR